MGNLPVRRRTNCFDESYRTFSVFSHIVGQREHCLDTGVEIVALSEFRQSSEGGFTAVRVFSDIKSDVVVGRNNATYIHVQIVRRFRCSVC